MVLMVFLAQVVIISLSGVMAPGPVTATTLAIGARNRYAGTLISIGHGIVEIPLIILITLGMGRIFERQTARMIIGLAGGVLLLLMVVQMFLSIKSLDKQQTKAVKDKAILAGIVLTAGNPYFLVWWATVGLKLATDARALGIYAFALFAIVHWLCDLIWYQILSWASFKGIKLLGPRSLKIVLAICSAAMFFFGIKFIVDAVGIIRYR
jgi:threonine/homoserine/homoserine lactone efflux protein